MGGTPEMFEIDKQMSALYDDLPEVTYSFEPTTSKLSIIDYGVLFENIHKEIRSYFKLNGIKFKYQEPGGAGGGAYSFVELLKNLLVDHNILGFIVNTFDLIKDTIKNFFVEKYNHIKPEITLHLSIGSDKPLDKIKDYEIKEVYSGYLISLLNFAKSLCHYLKIKHEFIRFNVRVSIYLEAVETGQTFEINEQDLTEFNLGRFINIINNSKMKHNTHSVYKFIRFNLIQRTDHKDGGLKKYYFLLSSKLLGE